MKKIFTMLFVCAMLFGIKVYAGNVILCKDIKEGVPKNVSNVWSKTDKGKICIFYEHDKAYAANTNFVLRISKKNDIGYFMRISSKDFPVQKGKQTSVIYNDMLDAGTYIFTIIDNQGFILGETNCTVQ
ncbi:MAG: hypothetical protein H6553_03455 [Chitinophagales bacterium]|nr:hypothetical protein [Chitinophagales bacterium]